MKNVTLEIKKRLLIADLSCTVRMQYHDRGFELVIDCETPGVADEIYNRRAVIAPIAWKLSAWYVQLLYEGKLINGFAPELTLRANFWRPEL